MFKIRKFEFSIYGINQLTSKRTNQQNKPINLKKARSSAVV